MTNLGFQKKKKKLDDSSDWLSRNTPREKKYFSPPFVLLKAIIKLFLTDFG